MCSNGDMVRDSEAVEEGDGPKISLEEGSDLVHKEGEIGVVSNDHILAPRNEEPEQEFVAEVFTSEIPRIATSLTNSQTVEKPTPSNTSEPCLMKQKKPLGEIPKSTEQVALVETIAKNTNMEASSILSESATSKLDPIVTLQRKSHLHVSLFSAIHISNIFGQNKNDVTILIYHCRMSGIEKQKKNTEFLCWNLNLIFCY
ncbi:uncharacterized protein LOC108320768 isoform X2 [Vigna angularis]|uniref:uncharacterized protein LOC108320768 isoform X2 n=1 Tax=Phaseolus angularis TaxID=3914 RepID=UPI0022B3ECD3|nr:uncharacterized protein LOC108320768 isoform X2 [Vigna angularis]